MQLNFWRQEIWCNFISDKNKNDSDISFPIIRYRKISFAWNQEIKIIKLIGPEINDEPVGHPSHSSHSVIKILISLRAPSFCLILVFFCFFLIIIAYFVFHCICTAGTDVQLKFKKYFHIFLLLSELGQQFLWSRWWIFSKSKFSK